MNPYLVKSNLFIRLLAMFYDLCFLLAILLIFGLIFTFFFKEAIFIDANFHWMYKIYINLIAFSYYFIFLKKTHQTPGMKICKLYLLDEKQEAISSKKIITRLVAAYLSILFFALGLIFSFFNKERETLYDALTKSYIYRLKKKSINKPRNEQKITKKLKVK